ncbi:Spy/CpxP family protein refolding chaperone [Xanthobacter sp. TB0136]|uniref:Spy/CpxP family protein refolding chaperone n=1 Tax=Xanthobacter sp. TB0136 TaxID=3459177 RepID=UPI0040390B89
MKKAVLAATAAALIAGTSVSFAAPGPGGPGGHGGPGKPAGWRISPEGQALLADARFAAVKSVLKLNAEQEKLFDNLQKTVKDLAKERADARKAAFEARKAERKDEKRGEFDPVARMRVSADRMEARANNLRKIADAAAPFYNSLDAQQKENLGVLVRGGFANFLGGMGPRYPGMGPGWMQGVPWKGGPVDAAPAAADTDEATDAADTDAE